MPPKSHSVWTDVYKRQGGMGMLVSLDTNKLKRALGKLSEGSTQSAALYDLSLIHI